MLRKDLLGLRPSAVAVQGGCRPLVPLPRKCRRLVAMHPSFVAVLLVALAACARPHPPAETASRPSSAQSSPAQPPSDAPLETRTGPPLLAVPSSFALELVESWPLETSLDHKDLRDAKEVWPELFGNAKERIDLAQFYASNAPGSALEKCVQAIEAAAARGVKVRFLAEEKFYKTYPETLDRLARARGVEVRRFFVRRVMGGVLHAKYFVIDSREAYLGSQNFDYRSLEHIQELGVRLRVPAAVRALQDLFEMDWAFAGGVEQSARVAPPEGGYGFPSPIASADVPAAEARASMQTRGAVTLVASPKGFLPDEKLWDLPALVRLIDSSKRSVRVQLLTYRSRTRGETFPDLEDALLRAAARGARVELLLSNWSLRKGTIEPLQKLHAPPGLTIKILSVPEWSGGFIPFARVAHAKYLVVDGERAWVGTSNWERDYFFQSRNVGVLIDGGPLPARLDAFFRDGWEGPYAAALDPQRTYEPPRVAK